LEGKQISPIKEKKFNPARDYSLIHSFIINPKPHHILTQEIKIILFRNHKNYEDIS